MPEIQTELAMSAPPEAVWRTLTGFAGFPDWNPGIRRIDGQAGPSEKLGLHLAVGGDRTVRVGARIIEWDPGRRLAWRGGLPPLVDVVHWFALEPGSGGGTLFHHGERFGGLLLAPFALAWPALEPRLRPRYEAVNAALAERAAS